jgi:hypothetical protein
MTFIFFLNSLASIQLQHFPSVYSFQLLPSIHCITYTGLLRPLSLLEISVALVLIHWYDTVPVVSEHGCFSGVIWNRIVSNYP